VAGWNNTTLPGSPTSRGTHTTPRELPSLNGSALQLSWTEGRAASFPAVPPGQCLVWMMDRVSSNLYEQSLPRGEQQSWPRDDLGWRSHEGRTVPSPSARLVAWTERQSAPPTIFLQLRRC
jgi:hypothetical protein